MNTDFGKEILSIIDLQDIKTFAQSIKQRSNFWSIFSKNHFHWFQTYFLSYFFVFSLRLLLLAFKASKIYQYVLMLILSYLLIGLEANKAIKDIIWYVLDGRDKLGLVGQWFFLFIHVFLRFIFWCYQIGGFLVTCDHNLKMDRKDVGTFYLLQWRLRR